MFVPLVPVTVSASFDAAGARQGARGSLEAWVAAGDGRTFVVDGSIAPVRWTVTVDYELDAPDEPAAQHLALERFASESAAAGIAAPETMVAATGPLS